jgi:hypothetical protein
MKSIKRKWRQLANLTIQGKTLIYLPALSPSFSQNRRDHFLARQFPEKLELWRYPMD